MFAPDQLAHIVATTIPATLPAGHTNALVGIVNNNGTRVAALFTLDDKQRWQFAAAWDHDWKTKADSVGAQMLFSWGEKK